MVNKLLEEVFYGPALVLAGSGLADEPLLAAARDEFEGSKYCVVREWMILDVMVGESDEKLISERGLQPVTLYAQRVLFDSTGKGLSGFRLTGFLRQFEDCFFETDEMVYVLGGRGCRKYVSMPALSELSKGYGALRHRPSPLGFLTSIEGCTSGDGS